MPTTIIWGCLRAAVDCYKRYLELYEKIDDQIKHLNTHINVLTEYEELFGHSSTMQELLQASYIDIIRFWRRVEKECNRCVYNRMARAVVPFSTSKLDGIIASIGKNADRMSLLVPAVQERLQRGERENAAEERRLAGLAREEQIALFQFHAEELKRRNEERKGQREWDVRKWLLGGASFLNESNFRHHGQNTGSRSPGTCEWLFEDDAMKAWLHRDHPASQLWVKACPGVGKSVLSAYAIEKVAQISPDNSAIIYQYYTVDEEFSAIQVYRCLAEQLADRLWTIIGDMPEDIHAYTQRSATSGKAEDVKAVIGMLVEKISTTYVFLDGLDEECDKGPRWHQLADVLDFFMGLASLKPQGLRLWCSSQHRTSLDPRLKEISSIEVTERLNSHDIEICLSERMSDLDNLELDQGYRTLILQDLREEADGCFLWASLMLHWMSNAPTLRTVQERSVEGSQREFVSILLACIVYAKRPLRPDELCECTAILGTNDGKNVDSARKLFKSKILELCQPLVQVQESEGPEGKITICHLTHASVRNFLLKNSQILNGESDFTACSITSEVMANICLKYLLQPRYRRLLTKKGETFVDLGGEDIMDHHLLSYAAKYWDKHMDDVTYSSDFCQKVSRYITSTQFYTLLQVQSLFVEGQFRFWLNSNRPWAGIHIRRVFPHWLTPNCDKGFERGYRTFVGEWGSLLDEDTHVGGDCEGEIDRCFFGALGPKNFLHKGPSRYKSFMFSEVSDEDSVEAPLRYYEGVDETGSCLAILKLQNLEKDSQKLEFRCENWCLSGRRPKLLSSDILYAPHATWRLYDYPLSKKVPGRPPPVSFTDDLRFMRIGSQVFSKGDDDIYTPLSILDPEEDYFEEMASGGRFIAVSTRRAISKKDLYEPEQTTNQGEIIDFAEFLAHELEEYMKTMDQQTSGPSTDTTLQTTSATEKSRSSSSNTSVSSFPVEEIDDIDPKSPTADEALQLTLDNSDILFQSSSESAGNSARTSWSDGSTELMSDETEDEDQWNDWGNERLTLEELEVEREESYVGTDSCEEDGEDKGDGGALPSDVEVESDLSERDAATTEDLNDRDDLDASQSNSEIESNYSPSNWSFSDSQGSDQENEDAALIEDMMLGNQSTRSESAQRASIRIYDTIHAKRVPVFHYTRFVKGSLFDSPPAFHPSKPLFVWPLGDGDILFGNYKANTYFTRELCRSHSRSCHVFTKTHFSRDGEYLHFAALEAREKDADDSKPRALLLSLQVSTHRLSLRKTTSSPPRLVFRTTVDLRTTSAISVSNLPYFMTWTDKELFFTSRNERLDVMRIPLFRSPTTTTTNPGTTNICYLKETIFLPRTASLRRMYFFPAPEAPTTVAGKKDKTLAALILGSHCSIPSQGTLIPKHEISPPIGVYLCDDTDLGGWTCKTSAESDTRQRVNNACGRLKGKFESFDRNEDCDIVPYLF